MTGTEFQEKREKAELSLRDLAERWDIHYTTIHRKEKGEEEVPGLWRDAILRVLDEVEEE